MFGAVLLLSAIGVFIGLFAKGYALDEIWTAGAAFVNPYGENFIPIFFVTVACGIVSGFHSTQATLISRMMEDEREGRTIFYNMMILEGFIAMVWSGLRLLWAQLSSVLPQAICFMTRLPPWSESWRRICRALWAVS